MVIIVVAVQQGLKNSVKLLIETSGSQLLFGVVIKAKELDPSARCPACVKRCREQHGGSFSLRKDQIDFIIMGFLGFSVSISGETKTNACLRACGQLGQSYGVDGFLLEVMR